MCIRDSHYTKLYAINRATTKKILDIIKNKYIKVKNKTCKEFNSEKSGVNKVNTNQQKIPIVSNFPKFKNSCFKYNNFIPLKN